jgi:hypothetical protein
MGYSMSSAWNRPRQTIGVSSNAKLCQSVGKTIDQVLKVANLLKSSIDAPSVLSGAANHGLRSLNVIVWA